MAYLAVGAVLVVVHAVAFETGSLTQSLPVRRRSVRPPSGSALVGVWRNRAGPAPAVAPDGRWVRASFVAGDLLWNWYEIIGEDPFPSIADVLYLAGYPFIALGLMLLIRRRLGDGDRGGLLDAAILTTGCGGPVVDLPDAAARRPSTELDPLSLCDQPGLPDRRPHPDRRRDGPADDAGRADGVVPAARPPAWRCSSSPTRSTRSRRSTSTYVSGGPIDTPLPRSPTSLFGAAAAPSIDAATDRSASGRRDLAGPGPPGLPGRGDGHRPDPRSRWAPKRRRARGRSRRAPRSCRSSSSPGWRASSGCSRATWRSDARSRRS